MIGDKVLLTYKRKRPLSGDGSTQENGYPDLSVEYTGYNASSASEKPEELAEGNKSENSGDNSEHGQKGKRLCAGCVTQQDCLVSAQESSRMEEKNNSREDVKQVISDLRVVSEGAPAEGTWQNTSGNQLCTRLHSDGKSYGSQEGSCSYVNPSLASGDKCTRNYSALPSVTIISDSDLINMKSSMEGNHSHEYVTTNASEERSGFLVQDKYRSLQIKAVQNKWNPPLITFRRRSKHKKDDNALEGDNTLPLGDNCSLPFEGCRPTASVNACGAMSPKNCSLQALENQSPLQKNISSGHSFNSCQEISSRDVNNSCACTRLIPEIGSFKLANKKLGNSSKDNLATVEEVLPQDSGSKHSSLQTQIGGDFRETPIGTGNSSDDGEVDPSHEPVLPECPEPVDKKYQSSSNCNLNTTSMTVENPHGRNTRVLLDLSVPPPDSPVTVDCNVAVEMGLEEQSFCSLSETNGGNPPAFFPEVSVVDKVLESMQEGIKEKQSSQLAQKLENDSSTQEAVGANNNSVKSSPVLAMKDNCLQLFPEGRAHDKSLEKATACADSGGTAFSLLPSTSNSRTTEAKGSHFLPVSLPVQAAVDNHASSATIPLWPNLGIPSTGLSQGRSQYSPDQTSSLLRQKTMFDSVANSARAVSGNRTSIFDLLEFPTKWSEEELDCLWIGVRRYGRANWDAMLRDPRLHFIRRRTPKDLAEQWDVEQSKLSSSSSFPTARPLGRPNVFPDSMDGFLHPKTGKQNLVNGVQLSLGDAHRQQKDNFQKRSLFNHMNTQSNVPRQIQNPVANTMTMHPFSGIHRRAMFENHPLSEAEPSLISNFTTSMDGNLPHWLKEAVAVPTSAPSDTTLPSGAASERCAEIQWINQPPLDPNGSHQGLRNMVTMTHRLPDSSELLMWDRIQRNNHLPAMGHENAERQEGNVKKQDLIIINSDASSEETISDDRSVRP